MTAQHYTARPLRDVLHEFVLATEPAPRPELLDEFARKYPEHATALTDFAVELALDSFADAANDYKPGELPSSASPAVAQAMSRFHNRLYAVRAAASSVRAAPKVSTENPFAALDRAQLRSLSQRLNAKHSVRHEAAGSADSARDDDRGISAYTRRRTQGANGSGHRALRCGGPA